MFKPRPSLLALLVLLVAPAIGLLNPALYKTDNSVPILQGQWQHSFEKAFDKSLPVREFALTTWGIIQFTVAGEGRAGVVVGRDGWLFTTEDFSYAPDYAKERAHKIRLIADIHKRLAEQGIDLQVFIVPDKSRVLAHHLGRVQRQPHTDSRYADVRTGLLSEGIATPDLLAALQRGAVDRLFLKTDTHWTPEGAVVAAQEIAQHIPVQATWRQHLSFVTTAGAEAEHRGDLLNFLRLGPLYEFFGFELDRFSVPVTRLVEDDSKAASASLFDEEEIPCTYVGTSNGANLKWNFVGALKQALGTDIYNAAQEGKGPFVPMAEYLASNAFTQTPPQCILWEIPERQIDTVYDLTSYYPKLPWLEGVLSNEP